MSWVGQFERDGYAVLEDFISPDDCDRLKTEIHSIIDQLDVEKEHKAVFNTRGKQQQLSDDYFLSSGDKIRYFFEKNALDSDGKLTVPKDQSLNKIAHALHWWNPVYKEISFSFKVQDLARDLGLVEPAIIQSMYIFKNPRVGGEVIPHQDASFLDLKPLKLYGIWIALDDATEENGCLWFAAGSHKTNELYGNRKLCRKTLPDGGVTLDMQGEALDHVENVEYTPVPIKKGSLLMIHGLVLHKSAANTSEKPRNAYALHFIEQKDTEWSELNWLQPTKELPFTPLFTSPSSVQSGN